MTFKRYLDDIKNSVSTELDILPVMNLMVMLIPFLLITIVFVEVSVFDIHLPAAKEDSKMTVSAENPAGKELLLIALTEDGIKIFVNNEIYLSNKGTGETINLEKIKSDIKGLKERYADREDIVLASDPHIKYSQLIDLMDILAMEGFKKISISGN